MRLAIAVAMLWAVAAINVFWVEAATIYSPDNAGRREVLHHAVLSGELPAGAASWDELGANTVGLRLAVPWLAERIHVATGVSLGAAYQLIEFVATMGTLALLFLLLARELPKEHAILGCLYLAAVLPLSAFLHYFQPWDKPALAFWIAGAMLILADAVVPATVVVAIAVLVKFDAVVLPVLYVLANMRRLKPRALALRSLPLWVASIVPFAVLQGLRPAASEPRDLVAQAIDNIAAFRDTWFAYPPMIGFLLPVTLGALGFSRASREQRSMYVFALGVLGILAATTNFVEIRAEFAPLTLMLPCALVGLGRILHDDGRAERPMTP